MLSEIKKRRNISKFEFIVIQVECYLLQDFENASIENGIFTFFIIIFVFFYENIYEKDISYVSQFFSMNDFNIKIKKRPQNEN